MIALFRSEGDPEVVRARLRAALEPFIGRKNDPATQDQMSQALGEEISKMLAEGLIDLNADPVALLKDILERSNER
jgi:hypothetical protein